MSNTIEILTVNEACKILRVSRPTLIKLIKSGKIKGFKVGTRIWKIPKNEVADYINKYMN